MPNKFLQLALIGFLLFVAGCHKPARESAADDLANKNNAPKPIRIGFLLETLKEERWARDKQLFETRARELGATVETLVADGNDQTQLQQAENLLTKGVDILVVVPHNGVAAAAIVNRAAGQNVPVIAYDRLILDSEVALYVSFDNVRVGEMQARYALAQVPRGNYFLVMGSPTDNNAKLFYQGQMNVLKSAQERGEIKIVGEQWATNWQASEALKHTENALTQNNDNIQAVVASADSVARGVVQALDARGLAGKVLVTGQDCDLTACQNIVAGKQTMCIYKPIEPLAATAAESAVKLAAREKPATSRVVSNNKIDVPSILLDPLVVDKNNFEDVIIKSGYQTREQVFKGKANGNL